MKWMRFFCRLLPVLVAFVALPNALAADKASEAALKGGSAVYKIKIEKGVSLSDAVQSMQLRANDLNLKQVSELPLSEQVAAMTGKPQRRITIFQFCNALVAKKLVDYNVDFAVFLPCRIALIEDDKGQGWLVMMDMDVAHLSKDYHIPPKLAEEMQTVREQLKSIMRAGASGAL